MQLTRDRVRPIQGTTYKLYSVTKQATLLGLLTVPPAMSMLLRERGYAQCFLEAGLPPISFTFADYVSSDYTVRYVTLREAYNHHELFAGGNGIEMFGATPEEIEAERGFGFAPSAAYLRSLLEAG